MATWFTADLHLGHSNIIGYCDRPFADIDDMNRALINNWNEAVAEDDTIWFVGDFALGRIAETLPLVAELTGHKILIAGNHDRCWAGHGRRAESWSERYLDAGFAEIIQGSKKIKIGRAKAVLCHFPYQGDSHDHDRFVNHRPIDKGAWLLHGHVHERWAQHGRMINVGVDANEFRPVDEATIADRIAAGPASHSTTDPGAPVR